MKIAFIHDWLVKYAGAERVLEQMFACYPEGDLFSVVDFRSGQDDFLTQKVAKTTFIQRLPFAKKHYRKYIGLMPLAIEGLDLSDYDIVISSSHAVAKGILVNPDQLHICMNYSPMRYAWDLQHQYLKETNSHRGLKGAMARMLLHYLRIWDLRTSNGVDWFIAISNYISRRIQKIYRREATVIYPPVDVEKFEYKEKKEDFYLTASRFVPYKRIDLIVETFSRLRDKKLVVIGDGPEMKKIKKNAGENVEIMGYQPHKVLKDYMQRSKAFIFAAEEDFGIVPIEAQACGTPVIAFGKGGALETIKGLEEPNPTGIFFDKQEVGSLADAVQKFEINRAKISPQNCRDNALQFNATRFRKEFQSFVFQKWNEFQEDKQISKGMSVGTELMTG